MADFKIDIDVLKETKKVYNTSAENITSIKNNLTTSLEELRQTGWASDAGKKFFEKYDDSWAKNVDKYTTLLSFMSELLTQAEGYYDEVVKESEKIQF